jgi:hypothetical protein
MYQPIESQHVTAVLSPNGAMADGALQETTLCVVAAYKAMARPFRHYWLTTLSTG